MPGTGKPRTKEEGVPLSLRLKRLTGGGRGSDVQLPLPAGGRKDPRLPASLSDVHRSFSEAGKGLKQVRALSRRR